jgi:uncharacterized BrkB/YihY/UPF0761 family membrane protein
MDTITILLIGYLVLGVLFAELAYQKHKYIYRNHESSLHRRYMQYIFRPAYIMVILVWPVILIMALIMVIYAAIKMR